MTGNRPPSSTIGVVVIGRNEGARLDVCLRSVLARADNATYVDSGSTDGSASLARALGANAVELDMSIPFTAGRARNEGFALLK
ncbi:glycosyltransferase, partial [Nostoc sp. NIES-2111]